MTLLLDFTFSINKLYGNPLKKLVLLALELVIPLNTFLLLNPSSDMLSGAGGAERHSVLSLGKSAAVVSLRGKEELYVPVLDSVNGRAAPPD